MTRTSPAQEPEEPRERTTTPPPPLTDPTFRFSGHQTFALRIAWIPKAVAAIVAGEDPLSDPDKGIAKLGLGKNMVEALRCWIEAFQIATRVNGKWKLTTVGEIIFHPKHGLDPYLEDVCTSWLLHWLITTNRVAPFFAWECLFNRWSSSEFSPSQIVEAFEKESKRTPKPASSVTLKQHWEVFLHSYHSTRGDKGEDHLDSAMAPLRLIQISGERASAHGRPESIFAFHPGRKSAIPQQLFAFFVHDWWNRMIQNEKTVPFRDLVFGDHSPGRVLKMHESEIVERLTNLAATQPKIFQIVDSMSLRQLHRTKPSDGFPDLEHAYRRPTFI